MSTIRMIETDFERLTHWFRCYTLMSPEAPLYLDTKCRLTDTTVMFTDVFLDNHVAQRIKMPTPSDVMNRV
jgi:hypothetical protein